MSISTLYRILCALGATLIIASAIASRTEVGQLSDVAFAGSAHDHLNTSADRIFASEARLVGAKTQPDDLSPARGNGRTSIANDFAQASLALSVVFFFLAVLASDAFVRMRIFRQQLSELLLLSATRCDVVLKLGQTLSTRACKISAVHDQS
jgi:hypothetical protein